MRHNVLPSELSIISWESHQDPIESTVSFYSNASRVIKFKALGKFNSQEIF